MKLSEQERQLALRRLKRAKLYLIALPIALVLGIWAPFYPKFLASAVVLGLISGLVAWLLFRSPVKDSMKTLRLTMIPTLLMIFGMLISRDIWLPRNLSSLYRCLVIFQSFAVALFFYISTMLFLFTFFKKEPEGTPAGPNRGVS